MTMVFDNKIRQRALLIAALTALSWGVDAAKGAVNTKGAESFLKLDSDGDGFSTAREAVAGRITTPTLQMADRDQDGKLSADEYRSAGLDKADAGPK